MIFHPDCEGQKHLCSVPHHWGGKIQRGRASSRARQSAEDLAGDGADGFVPRTHVRGYEKEGSRAR